MSSGGNDNPGFRLAKPASFCHIKVPTMAMEDVLKLDNYQISPTLGFLPSELPLTKLPKYYVEWETICSNLNALRIEKKLAARVAQLPLLTTLHLANEPEWRRAYVLLGFIANAYIWGSKRPVEVRAGSSQAIYRFDTC